MPRNLVVAGVLAANPIALELRGHGVVAAFDRHTNEDLATGKLKTLLDEALEGLSHAEDAAADVGELERTLEQALLRVRTMRHLPD